MMWRIEGSEPSFSMRKWGVFQAMLRTSAGCPTIQCNSDTVHPEIASDCTGTGLRSTRPASTSGTNCKPRLLTVLLTTSCKLELATTQMPTASSGCNLCFWPTGYKSEVSTTPSLGLINFLEQWQNLGNPFTHYIISLLQRIIKDGNQHKRRDTQVLNKGAFVLTLLGTRQGGTWKCSGSLTWTPSKPCPFGFLWRLHYTDTVD